MKKLVMTVELKEVECVEGQKPEPIGYVFARIADTVFYNAVRTAGAVMSLEDYIDRLCEMSDCIDEDDDYEEATRKLVKLAEDLDEDIFDVIKLYILPDDRITMDFTEYFYLEVVPFYTLEPLVITKNYDEPDEDTAEFSETNEMTKMLDKAYFMLKNLLNREVKDDEKGKGNSCM